MNSLEFKQTILSLSQRIYPIAVRMLKDDEEARDAIQEIMIKLWNKRAQLKQHPNIIGFVILTTRNYCLDQIRAKKSRQTEICYLEQIAESYTEQGASELKEVFMIVQQIISELPENQKEVILMRDIDGFEFDEIVAFTHLKIEHVRVLLSRARKQIRSQLEKIYSYEQGTSQ